MAKAKTTIYFCQNCGYESAKWAGQCPGCKQWNTFVEENISKSSLKNTGKVSSKEKTQLVTLSDVKITQEKRISSGSSEFDRVLGGGLVENSLVLLGGDPGIGKSTILLQTAGKLCENGKKLL